MLFKLEVARQPAETLHRSAGYVNTLLFIGKSYSTKLQPPVVVLCFQIVWLVVSTYFYCSCKLLLCVKQLKSSENLFYSKFHWKEIQETVHPDSTLALMYISGVDTAGKCQGHHRLVWILVDIRVLTCQLLQSFKVCVLPGGDFTT